MDVTLLVALQLVLACSTAAVSTNDSAELGRARPASSTFGRKDQDRAVHQKQTGEHVQAAVGAAVEVLADVVVAAAADRAHGEAT